MLFVLSFETARGVLRAECIEGVRVTPVGEEGSEVGVVWREAGGIGASVEGWAEVESSADAKLVLEVFVVDRALPWRREGGGGGGDF